MTDQAIQVIADRLNELQVPYAALKKQKRDKFMLKGWVLVTKDIPNDRIWVGVFSSKASFGQIYRGGLANL